MVLALRIAHPTCRTDARGRDAALVARARGGDRHAFEALVRAHKDGVLNLARRIVGDADAAQDVAQEAFIKAYRELRRFRGRSTFATWLYRIAINEARVYLRSQRRRQAQWEQQTAGQAGHPAANERDRPSHLLVELLQEVPEKHRVALALFYLQELSLREVAQAAGASEATVKSWLHRGRERLRELAKERGLV